MATVGASVEQFLQDINCEGYLGAFRKYEISSVDQLQHLDHEILEQVGIRSIGDRIRILNKSRTLQAGRDKGLLEELQQVIGKINALSAGPMAISEELVTDRHSVIFILNDGSAKKVNVNGCFNADSIKKKLIKRLPPEFVAVAQNGEETSSQDYDVFVVDYAKNVLHLLYDVELVTICHSSDRVEKNRLIFVSKDQTPSDKAILTSKKLYLKTMSAIHQLGSLPTMLQTQGATTVGNYATPGAEAPAGDEDSLRIDNSKESLRRIFNQRPPSELISTNLPEYFPHTDFKRLQKTLRSSFRQSVRMSMLRPGAPLPEGNNVGNILVNQNQAVDRALLQSLDGTKTSSRSSGRSSVDGDASSMGSERRTNASKSTTLDGRDSDAGGRIELLNSESESECDDDNIVSLPTKVVTPKSWLKGARIGSGSFGSVYLGMNAQTGELMAVKQVELQPTTVMAPSDDKKSQPSSNAVVKNSQIHRKMVDALQHEMNLLKELHHENIVTYYGSSQEGGNLNIFLEYVPGGSVSSMLNSYGPFEEPLVKNFTRQTLVGLTYLHRKNIIHRDIKGANLLIDIKGSVKITDFGISKKLSPLNKKQNKRASLQGSVYWMAPEVVKQVVTTEKADIWSVGCVVVEMFTGKHPFPDFSQMQAIFKIGTNTIPELPSWASDGAKAFLYQTFELDYKKRPSSVELLQHKWLDTTTML
ncbi:ABL011Cp [Eremothecium gossypii ATCC 10895]|uniref:Serine/threonine-protein kinase STE11 n=1 Tax=Eremothecium gossypii (strain ATCC 10895 / CBS 109.51 / FGSC 9923 / NRRL Y-1056) TaxID=284811 RepID=Q75DM8_EREGS|nr:ABL011Cp [Eremothecium gossypii ATCC 10895]AAS50760.2 ABL011Cp [Eremothecium gossypii ATCC 10895]